MAAAAGTAAGRVLPASPNWYCSRCSDTSADGRFFGFAARHRICLLDVSSPAAPAFYGTVVKRGVSLPPSPASPHGVRGFGEGDEGGLGRLGVLTGLASVSLQGSCSGTRTGWPPSPSAGTPRTAASAPAAPTMAACSCGTPTAWARWRSTTCTR